MVLRFLTFLFIAQLAHAENLLFEQIFDLDHQLVQLEEQALISPDRAIINEYKKAKNFLQANKFADAGTSLEQVMYLSNSRGYTGIPYYSMDLLLHVQDEEKIEHRKFLLTWAEKLSHDNPRVLMSIATYYKDVGLTKSFKYLMLAVSKTFNQPSTFLAIFITFALAVMFSSLMAIFYLMLIKIVRNLNEIKTDAQRFLTRILPKVSHTKFDNVIVACSCLIVLLMPFYFGLIPGLLTWSVVLALVLKPFYATTMGIICIVWGSFFPLLTNVGINVANSANVAFEELNSSMFSPKAEKYIKQRLESEPNDLLSLFYLSQAFRFNGEILESKNILEQIFERADKKTKKIIDANIGVLEFDLGNYEVANQKFKQAEMSGIRSFETYYNLALVNLSLVNTSEYEKYFAKAKEIDQQRVSKIVLQGDVKPKALILPLSSKVLFKNLFEKHSVVKEPIVSKVFSLLMFKGSSKSIFILGFIVFLFAIKLRNKKQVQSKVSLKWLAFPMGRYLASKYYRVGFIFLIFFISLILLTQFPILFGRFYALSSIGNEIFIFGFIVFSVIHFLTIFEFVNAK